MMEQFELPPGVTRDELEGIAKEHLDDLVGDMDDAPRSFLHIATRWLVEWHKLRRTGESKSEQQPCAFVLSARPGRQGLSDEFEEALLFRESYETDIGGRVLVCNTDLSTVYVAMTVAKNVHDIAHHVNAMGFGDKTTLVYAPSSVVSDDAVTQRRGAKFAILASRC